MSDQVTEASRRIVTEFSRRVAAGDPSAFDDLVAGTPDAPGVSRADLDAAVDFVITNSRQRAV